MIKIEKIKVEGWEAAIRGMRNPLNSWDKSDSKFLVHMGDEGVDVEYKDIICDIYSISDWNWHDLLEKYGHGDNMIIGPNDLDLAMRLAKAGTEHRKFMRMINVTMDITAPLYWWKEKDTYKVGTVANSCSTMHTIHKKPFELDDFSHDHIINMDTIEEELRKESTDSHGFFDYILGHSEEVPTIMLNDSHVLSPEGGLEVIIKLLNKCRDLYLKTKDKKYWWQMIQLLPSSYNQKRTVQTNYEVLAGIYRQRKNHKLDEWHTFCHMIENLPCSELITLEEE